MKYSLLKHILEEPNLSILELSEVLLISESKLFRKIKELNILLKEFGLTIKNTQILGNEEQIRYLYYSIFSLFHPSERPDYLNLNERNQYFVNRLEESLRLKFNSSTRDKISCWIGISDKRRKIGDFKIDFLLRQKKIYQDDHLYQLLDSLFYQVVYANQDKNNCETILFYGFFVSFYILDKESYYKYDIFRSKKIPAVMLNIRIREKLLNFYRHYRLAIDEEKSLQYQLSQINNKFYFFTGTLSNFQQKDLLFRQSQLMEESVTDLLAQLCNEAEVDFQKGKLAKTSLDELMFGYGNAILLLEMIFAPNITILYDLSETPLYQIPLEQFIKNHLRGIENIKIEPYQEDITYDLLITSKRNDERKAMYYLSEVATNYDIIRISQKIESLKQEKASLY
ncbi:helix-turn-helix domain-containing protein [Lactococcus fujiensis]|uniref:helix-turn-helix domain-containing protein n=1 Tax=Lactococcus fujiensis TaxID=610251 RepID=UPI002481E4A9|nr:helix-turn-helix domain-containing protein [Lactococcus fujiensis]